MTNLLPDIPRLYTALAEWAACMVFLYTQKRKISGWHLAVGSALMLVFQSLFLVLTTDIGYWLWLPCMIAAVLFMIIFLHVCIQGSWCDAVYCGLQAFVVAEFAAALEWQIYLYFFHCSTPRFIEAMVLVTVYGVIYLIVWRLFYSQNTAGSPLNITWKELCNALLITVSVFAMSNLSFLQVDTPFSSRYGDVVNIIRTMMDFAGVALMYAYHVQRNELRARRELGAMQNVLQNQYQQYRQSKESIDMINYKYHDLKHQIALLRAETDAEKRNAFLNHMEEEIQKYEAENKTGNNVVDTILTGKNVTCQKYGIALNCVVDGTLLNFMEVMDICSILGNALDNAIECERKIPEKEKRLIHVAIFSQKKFLILRFENYFEGKLELKEGIPVTTKKKENGFHGYGIKSIKDTVKKYGGAVSISTKDDWFELKILIPLQKG